jgi:hypothetical protein
MQNPVDYVAGLSLTFEQANLDFARHFATRFARVGDADTATLIEQIHRDEIAHVAYGLKWFRRWKQPGEPDWDAFCRVLKFPLTPQRAKGFSFNAPARRAAGFDEPFITELEVFAQSKGRTPRVFVFNSLAEGRLAHGPGFQPARAQAQLARDLETLPQFLARQDDVVLVSRKPRVEFLRTLKDAGFALPEFVVVDAKAIAPGHPLRERKLGGLQPWAWAPDSVELLAPLAANVSGGLALETKFNARLAPLFSKAWSAAFLRDALTAFGAAPWLCGPEAVGVVADNVADVLTAVNAIRARGHHRVVVKEEFGLAGGNALRLWEPELLETQRRWIERAVSGGRRVVVEPWWERVADFSVQLEMTARGRQRLGYCALVNDAKGQFQANRVAPGYARRPDPAWLDALGGPRAVAEAWTELFDALTTRLERELRARHFTGPLGIDAFLYRDDAGVVRLKPVVEINPRYTMGRLTLELMHRVAPGSTGEFRIVNRGQLRALGCEGFGDFAARQMAGRPLVMAGAPVPRIVSGTVCLTDPQRAEMALAVLVVSCQRSAFSSRT